MLLFFFVYFIIIYENARQSVQGARQEKTKNKNAAKIGIISLFPMLFYALQRFNTFITYNFYHYVFYTYNKKNVF